MKTRDYQLTEDEARIIDAYRGFTEYGKRWLLKQVRVEEMCEEEEAQERREKLTVIK